MQRMPALLIATICACVAIGLIIPIVRYHLVAVPTERALVQQCDDEIAKLEIKMKEVTQVDEETARTKKGITALTNIELGRMRYSRLFEKICMAMPGHTWFRSFAVTADPEPSRLYQKPLGGKRWQIVFSGYSTGETAKEMDLRLIELIHNLRRELGVADEIQTAKLYAE